METSPTPLCLSLQDRQETQAMFPYPSFVTVCCVFPHPTPNGPQFSCLSEEQQSGSVTWGLSHAGSACLGFLGEDFPINEEQVYTLSGEYNLV